MYKNMENEIKKKKILITGVVAIKKRDTGDIIGLNIIETEKNSYGEDKELKYAMFLKKQNGETTKANTQYTENGYGIGKEVVIAYTEEEYQYPYKDKKTGEDKTGKGMNRKILFFVDEPKVPTQEEADEIPLPTYEF